MILNAAVMKPIHFITLYLIISSQNIHWVQLHESELCHHIRNIAAYVSGCFMSHFSSNWSKSICIKLITKREESRGGGSVTGIEPVVLPSNQEYVQ